MKPEPYRSAEVDTLTRCDRARLRETVARSELLDLVGELLRVSLGPEGIAYVSAMLQEELNRRGTPPALPRGHDPNRTG